jgi:TonB family protein
VDHVKRAIIAALYAVALLCNVPAAHAQQDIVAYTFYPKLTDRDAIRQYVDSVARRTLARGAKATTLMWLRVRTDGSTTDATVKQSSGSSVLDSAAVRVVQQMKWTAAEDGHGRRVDVRITLPVVFSHKPEKQ